MNRENIPLKKPRIQVLQHAHHGELLQGMFFSAEDRTPCRALVTLPCPLFASRASLVPDLSGELKVEANRWKALKAAELTRKLLDRPQLGGVLSLDSNITDGWGCGSSTADVVASIRVVAKAAGVALDPSIVASLAVQAESASDSIMFEQRVVLFAHREGRLLYDFHKTLPELAVLGFASGEPVDTLKHPPAEYDCGEVQLFRVLFSGLKRALETHDLRLLGRICTLSADMNERFLPKPHFSRLKDIAREVGALGVQVAHSGCVVGLLFDSSDYELPVRIRQTRLHLNELRITNTWQFCSSGPRKERAA